MNVHKGHRQRVREKIRNKGFNVLYPHEFLEYVLFACNPRRDTNELAHKLIHRFGSIENVFNAKVEELEKFDGMGETSAILLNSYAYFAQNFSKSEDTSVRLKNIGEIQRYFWKFFKDLNFEEFHLLILTEYGDLIGHYTVKGGSQNKVYVEMDVFLKEVINLNPHTVVFAHNHPSGNVIPSSLDNAFTEKYFSLLKTFCKTCVVEHLIFGGDGQCFSYRNNGLLKFSK